MMGARVVFSSEQLEVEVPLGSSLLEAAEVVGAPVGSHCGGVCGCSACHIYVRGGDGLLSPMESDEDTLLEGALEREPSSRLACQAALEVAGVVEVEISEESFEVYLDAHPEDAERVLALRGII